MFSHSIPLRFATVVAGALGSGRAIDIDAQTIAAISDGQPIWVASVRRRYLWNSTSTDTNDNTTAGTVIQPTAVGGAGRFIWDGNTNNAWSTQLAWYVDSANTSGLANYENSGLTALLPLSSGAELDRRTSNQFWGSGAYNVYFLSSVASPDYVRFSGFRNKNSTLWRHGSATPGQAPAANLKFTSTVGFTGITAQNRATNTRVQLQEGDAGFDWNTAGAGATSLVSTSAVPNIRLRLTTGTQIGAVAWCQRRASAIQGNLSTAFALISSFTGPIASSAPAEYVYVGNEKFVAETLIVIDLFTDTITDNEDQTTNVTGFGLLCDSIFFGVRNVLGPTFYWGCGGVSRGSNTQGTAGVPSSLRYPERFRSLSCHSAGGEIARGSYIEVFGEHHTTRPWAGGGGGLLVYDGDSISEGVNAYDTTLGLHVSQGLGATFNAGNGFIAGGQGFIDFGNLAQYGVTMWGSGNTNAGIQYTRGTSMNYSNVPVVTGTNGDQDVAGVFVPWSQGSVLDPANGIFSIRTPAAPRLVLNDGNGGAALTMSFAYNPQHKITLTAAVCVLTLTAPSQPGLVQIAIGFDATAARAITWPAAVLWPAGVAPVLTQVAGKRDIVQLYWDGTNYFGTFALNY